MRIVRIVSGFVMLFVGVAGLILPIMPGWIFVIPGLVVLGREFHWARRLLNRLKKFHPKNFRSNASPET
ncbi:MAG: PGPGW domain-containing protein [Acidobacteria bacterium]|nr:PGPGW domain-containing protein [Acidobacteriota bacterium]